MLPSRASDAGPLARTGKLDPNAIECACGNQIDVAAGYRCQGASPDECLTVMCEGCRQACHSCGLPVCGEHVVDFGREKHCCQCVLLAMDDAARELAEACEVVE